MKFLNVRLIDGGRVQERVDLEIEDRRVKSVTPSSQTASTDSANPKMQDVMDMAGQTVLPGLMDLHVHVMLDAGNNPEASLHEPIAYLVLQAARRTQAMLEAGITTARDVGGMDFAEMSLKRAINEGWLPGCRLLTSGKLLTMTGGHGHFFGQEVDGEDEARKYARLNLKMGADCIKMMATGGVLTPGVDTQSTQLSEAELRAGFEEAHKAGKITASHAQGTQGIKNAIRAGVRTIEHGIFLDDEAIQMMIERGTYLSATLAAPKMIVDYGEAAGIPRFAVEKSRQVMETHLKSFEAAYRAGVKIACGSDAGTPFNLHNDLVTELQMMHQSGMSVLEVLNAATYTSAEALRLDDQLGTLQPGKLADFLVVAGDPLTDLEVLRRPALVFKEGKLAFRATEGGSTTLFKLPPTELPMKNHSEGQEHTC